ncbi:MAG: serine/threonine-protein phosphatase [Pyrinomonadaceae bacterium]|nr:serine/threonine-protein phosphatase [Phycisphaerales bacterium]
MPPLHIALSTSVFEHSDLEVASIQRLLLPRQLPSLEGWDIASHYQPCDASGGDFYGFQTRMADHLQLLVADVSGHGARAAVVMAMLRAWLESHQAFELETANIAGDMNTLFNRIEGLGVFVTGVFANINLKDGSFRYINCGHPFPRIVRASGVLDVLRGGHCLPLGIADDLGLEGPGMNMLSPGDALVFYTDGIIEAASQTGARFEESGLDASVIKGGSSHEIVSRLLCSLTSFRQDAPRLDDECVLVVKRSPRAVNPV